MEVESIEGSSESDGAAPVNTEERVNLNGKGMYVTTVINSQTFED